MMNKPLSILTHIFFPNKCMFCDSVIGHDEQLCKDCLDNAPFTDITKCLICGHHECQCKYYFRYMLSPFYYEMGCDTAIRNLKFFENLQNAQKLAFFMADMLKKSGLADEVDLIIPAPLYIKDKKQRGYNQAYLLAKQVSMIVKKPLLTDILIKIKKTKKQHELNALERYNNLNGAFFVLHEKQALLANKTVLLVDDVFTTGTTMNCCAKELINAGATQIIALTAAKTRHTARTN